MPESTKVTEMYKPDAGMKKIPVTKPKGSMLAMESPNVYVPSFYVSDKQMPEIKEWKVGNRYKIVLEVEQKSFSEDHNRTNASFDIIAYKVLSEKKS